MGEWGGVEFWMKMGGVGKIEGGMIISIGANKVPRVIGKEGSMVKMIKNATGCEITVGQNGRIWISGNDTDNEVAAKKIIELIADNVIEVGLTDRVEKFIGEMGLDAGNVEIVKEGTDK